MSKMISISECYLYCGLRKLIDGVEHNKKFYPNSKDKRRSVEADIFFEFDGIKYAINYHGCHWHKNNDDRDLIVREYFECKGYKYIIIRSLGHNSSKIDYDYRWNDDCSELCCPELDKNEQRRIVLNLLVEYLGVKTDELYYPSDKEVLEEYGETENSLYYKEPHICKNCKIDSLIAKSLKPNSHELIWWWSNSRKEWKYSPVCEVVDNYKEYLKREKEHIDNLKEHNFWKDEPLVCIYYCVNIKQAQNTTKGCHDKIECLDRKTKQIIKKSPHDMCFQFYAKVKRILKKQDDLKIHNLWVDRRDVCEYYFIQKDEALKVSIGDNKTLIHCFIGKLKDNEQLRTPKCLVQGYCKIMKRRNRVFNSD